MTSSRACHMGLSTALLAVSAMVTVPFGPVPFTLQTMVLALLPVVLGGRDAVCSVALYLLLGAVGLPVFSGLSGGVAHLLGPTGGFLWGFLIGTALAAVVCGLRSIPERTRFSLGALLMLTASYAAGTAQLSWVMGVSPRAAAAMAVLPFVGPDLVKMFVGVSVGLSVRRALGLNRSKSA